QTRCAVLVVRECLHLGRERRSAERQEVATSELSNRRSRHPISDADLTLCERCLVSRLDLFRNPLVGLLGTFPNHLPFPGEAIPPDVTAFVDSHLLGARLRR